MRFISHAIAMALASRASATINFISDPGVYGPPLEIVHAYYGHWPTGIAVSSTGRMFSNFPGGLDKMNVYNGSNENFFTVGELTSLTTEVAYPNLDINHPPGGAINYTTTPATSANYRNHLISAQSVVIDSADRLWILDTGRVQTPDGKLLTASPGGPKLVGVDITTDKVFRTIVFPPDVAPADSYLNDVRLDLRDGEGFAYITDSSQQGRNAIVVVNLNTGESWRRLSVVESMRSEPQFLSFLWGQPKYFATADAGGVIKPRPPGWDGIALSADCKTLYFGRFSSRYLYSVPTARLRARGLMSEIFAQQSVINHGQKGHSDGFETDSNNLIYIGNNELNAINSFNPANGTLHPFVRDPRINWVDSMSVAEDGYLYFTVNQLLETKKVRPFALFKAFLPNDGMKVPQP